MILAELGLTNSLLSVGFLAAMFGLLIAKTGNKWWHDLLLFPCAMVGSAVLGAAFGPVLAARIPGLLHADIVITLVIGIIFHPVFNALASIVPAYLAKRANGGTVVTPVPLAVKEDK